jgi:predicted nucleic acid-binding protein
MVPATFRVVLDANVLFPFTLRDTLLRAAAAGYFQLYWSDEILDEARRNLVGRGVMNEEQAERLFSTMRKAFPEAAVNDFESLIDGMPNHEKDRHVAAAAVKAGAQVIVTFNRKDFRDLPEGLEAHSPSTFLTDLLDLDPAGVIDLLTKQAAALKRPQKTLDLLLDGLGKTVPGFVEQVRIRLKDKESGGGSGGG